MSDLISRQAAIALADTLKDDVPDDERIADAVMAHNEGILEYQTKLSLLPSAQPEIIRCKDCEHWETSWQNDYAPNYHYCPLVDGTRRDDFYCADAERKGEQNG